MLIEVLILFIIITVLMLILSIYTVESDKPEMSVPFIMVGMIFSILCAYGFANVEFFYIHYENVTNNSTEYIPAIFSTTQYAKVYPYIFVLIVFIFAILLFRAGYNLVMRSARGR